MNKVTFGILLITLILIGLAFLIAPVHLPKGIDKICHFTVFFLTTIFFFYISLKTLGQHTFNHLVISILLLGGVVAAITEKIQDFMPYRSCEPLDWLANVSGIGLGILYVYFVQLKMKKKQRINPADKRIFD